LTGILSNTRHEAFANAIARGETIDAAFVGAGYSRNSGNASRLNRKDSIVARVGELKALVQKMQNRSLQAVALNRQWITTQLIEVVFMAKARERPDLAAANKALNLLGLDCGMFVERKEVGNAGEFVGLSMTAKRERLDWIANQLGLGRLNEDGSLRFGLSLPKPPNDVGHE
jgi:hypothetical protein